jgi:hypothetical protein
MKSWARCLLAALAAAATLVALAAVAGAETCTLEIKRLAGSRTSIGPADYVYRSTYPQYMTAQIGTSKSRIRFGDDKTADFKRIVKKEPQYNSDQVFRSVAKFGSQEYAFALDVAAPPEGEAKKEKSDDKESKTEGDTKKESKKSEGSGLAAALLKALSGDEEPAETAQPKAVAFDRLYFDANHNGDLTDDKVIEAEKMPVMGLPSGYARFQFPAVDVTIDADGTPVEYAFFLTGTINSTRDFSYASVQINSAAYREGDITLDGKTRHLVLLDFNSNGRFDDEITISKDTSGPGGRLYPTQGDMLLVDPGQAGAGYSPYEVTSSGFQHYVSKLVNIDGKYYDLKIAPAGDKLTLTPSSLPLGRITNPNARFNGVIYGDNGFLKISGEKDKPIALPVGQWKLLSYTIDVPAAPPEEAKSEDDKEKGKDDAKKAAGVQALARALEGILGGGSAPAASRFRPSIVTATATADYKPVEVREGETVVMPFGPPYTPKVTIDYMQPGGPAGQKMAQLGMTLVGSTGEVCSNMIVGGTRPGKPEFTIKDPDGKEVEKGSFEYG